MTRRVQLVPSPDLSNSLSHHPTHWFESQLKGFRVSRSDSPSPRTDSPSPRQSSTNSSSCSSNSPSPCLTSSDSTSCSSYSSSSSSSSSYSPSPLEGLAESIQSSIHAVAFRAKQSFQLIDLYF